MRTATILLALLITVKLSGQGMQNSLPGSAGSGKDLIVFTFYRQCVPSLESVTFLSNGQAIYATCYNRLKKNSLHKVMSRAKSAAIMLMRFVLEKGFNRDRDVKEIIIPLRLENGQRIYLFPQHRLVIAFTHRTHHFPLVKPIFITGPNFSVWLKVTL